MNQLTRENLRVGLAILAFGVLGASAAPVRFAGGSYDGYDASETPGTIGVLSVDNADGATSVKANSARLNGSLWDAGGTQAEVSVYWGPTDGETNKLAWSHRIDFGVCTPVRFLSTNITGLVKATAYHYRFYAANLSGQESWSEASSEFTTMSPPVVTTGAGATSLGLSTATLNGNLTSSSGMAVLSVYWGENTNALSASTNLGTREEGAFSTPVSGLRSGARYYYRSFATNEFGSAWSEYSSFRTIPGPVRFGGGSYDGHDVMTLQTNFEWGPRQTVVIVR